MEDPAADSLADKPRTWVEFAHRILRGKHYAAHKALQRRLAAHERTETRLVAAHAANEDLLRALAERHRPDGPMDDVQGLFESAFAGAPIGMALVDTAGRWLEVNDALCRIVGLTREAFRATTLHAIAHPEDVRLDEQPLRDLLAGVVPSYQVEKRYRHGFGHYFWVLLTVSLIRDQGGEPVYLLSQVQDITERKELAARLEHLIDHDFLTGLFNRRRFQQEMAREAERMSRNGTKGAVLMIDLDNFKTVNDTFGHKAGDDLLRGVAGALRHCKRKTDVLSRVGGDEFALLLPETDAEQAQVVAEGIVKTLSRQAAVLGDQSIPITASVGVAAFDTLPPLEVLEFADLAMYEAKDAGRNRVAAHHPGVEGRPTGSRRSEVELIRSALDEDRMLLYCQPILDLASGQVNQYELLLRLRPDATSEPLLPSAFLYVAERFNLIQEIDCWVALRAVGLIAEYGRAGRSLVLHVNLSGKTIGSPAAAAVIEKAILDGGIDPTSLVFELTETAAITHIEDAKAFSQRLQAHGCRFALDDFGAGFGSFYYLKSLPFDYFKIDGDFVRGLVSTPTDRLVIDAIVGIARGMGKKTIAESVPDEDTRVLLGKCGVDHAQGFFVGRPRPLRDVLPSAPAVMDAPFARV